MEQAAREYQEMVNQTNQAKLREEKILDEYKRLQAAHAAVAAQALPGAAQKSTGSVPDVFLRTQSLESANALCPDLLSLNFPPTTSGTSQQMYLSPVNSPPHQSAAGNVPQITQQMLDERINQCSLWAYSTDALPTSMF